LLRCEKTQKEIIRCKNSNVVFLMQLEVSFKWLAKL